MKSKISDTKFLNGLSNFISQNVASISMVGGLLAIAGALYEAYKASDEIHKINEEFNEKVEEINAEAISEDEKADKIKDAKGHKVVQTIFAEKKTIAFAAIGMGLEIFSSVKNGMAIAGLSTLLATKQDQIKTIVKNAKENLDPEKFEAIKTKTVEEMVSKQFMTKDGPQLIGICQSDMVGDIYLDTTIWRLFQFDGTEEDLLEVIERAEDYCCDHKSLQVDKYFGMLGFELPDDYPKKSMFWGPNRPFGAHIEKMTVKGAVFKAIVYDYEPNTAKLAGCPFAK